MITQTGNQIDDNMLTNCKYELRNIETNIGNFDYLSNTPVPTDYRSKSYPFVKYLEDTNPPVIPAPTIVIGDYIRYVDEYKITPWKSLFVAHKSPQFKITSTYKRGDIEYSFDKVSWNWVPDGNIVKFPKSQCQHFFRDEAIKPLQLRIEYITIYVRLRDGIYTSEITKTDNWVTRQVGR
ncbi:MAG: hypothetical protein GY756_13445 [bacterium]|nr:hypothetical protein [bacterium]